MSKYKCDCAVSQEMWRSERFNGHWPSCPLFQKESTPPVPSAAEALPEWVKSEVEFAQIARGRKSPLGSIVYLSDALERERTRAGLCLELATQAQRERHETDEECRQMQDRLTRVVEGATKMRAQLAAQAPVIAAALAIDDLTLPFSQREDAIRTAVIAYRATLPQPPHRRRGRAMHNCPDCFQDCSCDDEEGCIHACQDYDDEDDMDYEDPAVVINELPAPQEEGQG